MSPDQTALEPLESVSRRIIKYINPKSLYCPENTSAASNQMHFRQYVFMEANNMSPDQTALEPYWLH